MGGWRLEVFRMSCYVALPIVCFYFFNKPEYFREVLTKNRRFYFSNEDPDSVNPAQPFEYKIIVIMLFSLLQVKQIDEYKKIKEKEIEAQIQAEIDKLKTKNK